MASYYDYREETNKDQVVLHRDRGSIDEPTSPVKVNTESRHHSFAQPLPSPLHSPTHQSATPQRESNSPREMSSRSSSEEDLGTRSVTLMVTKDTGTKVDVALKAHGLKKKKSFLNTLVTVFKKPNQPSALLANGKFTDFVLNETSLKFTLEVKTDKKKKKKGNANRVDTFVCEIKRFPSKINPDSAEFQVLEPASGESFILLSLIKVDNLNIDWKQFMDANGTIDITTI